jgi:hypothetical protein
MPEINLLLKSLGAYVSRDYPLISIRFGGFK